MAASQANRRSAVSGIVLCFLSIVLIEASGAILNLCVYSDIASYFGIGREFSTLMGALVFLAAGLVALKKPSVIDVRQITFVVLPMMIVTTFLLILALDMKSPLFITIGFFCRALGNAWALIMFAVAVLQIENERTVLIMFGSAGIVSSLLYLFVPSDLSPVAGCVIVMLCNIVPIALMWKMSEACFQRMRQGSTATLLGIEQFKGYGSVAGLLFCMLFTGIASGYAITFNEVSNAPHFTIGDCCFISLIVAGVVFLEPRRRNDSRGGGIDDVVFSFAALLIIAGFLAAPFSFGSDATIANMLLRAGRECFSILIWLVLYAIGRRNIFALLPILGLVRFMSSAGTDIGAIAGHVTNVLILGDSTIAEAMVAVFVFLFVAFLWLFFRDFSFTRAIQGVRKIEPPDVVRIDDYLEARCRELGRSHSLTSRETEILSQLAKGRDGKFIQNEYVLSYNTVKTHIKHIYSKLDVHSRQELIDLVESYV